MEALDNVRTACYNFLGQGYDKAGFGSLRPTSSLPKENEEKAERAFNFMKVENEKRTGEIK